MERSGLVCVGCGAKIQTVDVNVLGYAPASSLKKEVVVCQRCFRLRHYNEIQDVDLTQDDFLKILHDISLQEALLVMVVDIFDFAGSWLDGIQRFAGKNPVLLIGNKVDLLPKSVKKEKLTRWMRGAAQEFGLKAADVLLISSSKGQGVSEAIVAIERLRRGKDVYVIGCTNVGKSTFINAVIRKLTGTGDVITTSHYPGTTLDVIRIPLDGGQVLVDTPGIINPHQMAHFVTKEDLRLITPKKEMKVRNFQLNAEQTLFFGGLARLDFVKGKRNSFACYLANDLLIHRTKLENADALYEKQVGELLVPPREPFAEMIKQTFRIREGKTDIVFSGLGWVTVNGDDAVVIAHAPKGVQISLRKSLIG